MIELYQFSPGLGVTNLSPFCLKLETFLKLNKLDYEVVEENDPRKSATGKFPYIKYDGKEIFDSHSIISFLTEKHNLSCDTHLSADQQALSRTTRMLIEDHLYWVMVYSRWGDDEFWPIIKNHWFGGMPLISRKLIPIMARKKTIRDMMGHGIAIHPQKDIYQEGIDDLDALACLMGDSVFFHGELMTSIDAVIFAILVNIIDAPIESPLRKHACKQPVFLKYIDHIKNLYYNK